MMGSTHRMVGIVTGIALAVCGIFMRDYLMVIMPFVVPVGAMLPDIDHNSSKLGRERKKVVRICKIVVMLGTVLWDAYNIYRLLHVGDNALVLLVSILISGLLLLIGLAISSDWGQKKFKFFIKHRGIMHTLLVPSICLFLPTFVVTETVLRLVLVGIGFGYITHLLGDCLTKEGCPLLWPLTSKSISLLSVTTNTKSEKVVAVLLSITLCITVVVFYGSIARIM